MSTRTPKPKKGTSNVVQSPKGSGPYFIQPFIDHPPYCVCDWCPKHRNADEWDKVVSRRINWKSKFPFDFIRSVTYADAVKREEERLLAEAVEEARRRREVLGLGVSFHTLCELYSDYQKEKGKRYDKDRYRIDLLDERFGSRDAASIDLDDVDALTSYLRKERGNGQETINRYITTLIAILNLGKSKRKIQQHGLGGVKKEKSKKVGRPKTYSRLQIDVLFGPAMDKFEREQVKKNERLISKAGKNIVMRGSILPLRGLCLIAYRTLMRPSNNCALRWEELHIDEKTMKGHFDLGDHKNADKGVEARGPLSYSLITYLISMRPEAKPKGYVHPNLRTGKPYVNIRKQWKRLIEIANELLPDDEQIGPDLDFYNLRHTGASELVAHNADPVMIVRMMGDTSLATVMKHYFDSSLEHMQEIVERWDAPAVEAESAAN